MDVLIGCGLQKAFFHKEGTRYMGEKADTLKVRIKSYLKGISKEHTKLYLMREIHELSDRFYTRENTGFLPGTKDIEIPEEFAVHFDLIFNNIRYNGLYKTLLDSEITKIKPNRVFIIGVETHTTVMFTAEELRNRGYEVYVVEPLLSSYDEYLHAIGITIMKNFLSVNISEE